ncbi:MAG: FtsX-like permease family protein, partial [Gammaproteobacteria bacterium]
VLRRELGPLPPRSWLLYGAIAVAVAMLMVWQVGDVRLAAYLLGGTALTFGLLGGGAAALVWVLAGIRRRVGVAWRFGLGNVVRRARASVAQILALGLAIMVLLLLSLVRVDLLHSWRQSLPPDAPNHFLINIQSAQVPAVKAFFAARGLASPALYPMVRGRLVAINGRAVGPDDYRNPRAKRLIERDFNLSWASSLQTGNRIVAGRWWTGTGVGKPWLSMEEGIAHTLGVHLGDRLTYRVAGRDLQVSVASLRSVAWDTFRVNFFAVLPPGVLDDYPATWVTSFHLPADRDAVLAALVKRFPNVTDIDVAALMQRVRTIIERVALGVQYVFGFTLIAGLVVLFAAIQSSQDERRYECAVLKTLGVSRRQLQKGLIAEFMLLGCLAGLLAGLGATLAGWLLATEVFHIDYRVDVRVWVVGMVCGAAGVALAGLLGTRRVLAEPPLATLRQP